MANNTVCGRSGIYNLLFLFSNLINGWTSASKTPSGERTKAVHFVGHSQLCTCIDALRNLPSSTLTVHYSSRYVLLVFLREDVLCRHLWAYPRIFWHVDKEHHQPTKKGKEKDARKNAPINILLGYTAGRPLGLLYWLHWGRTLRQLHYFRPCSRRKPLVFKIPSL